METIRRKTSTVQQEENEKNSPASAASSFSVSKEPEFRHGILLLLSMATPLVIILAFGGKATILTVCFGSIIAYIFDLLGTIEGTLMAVFVVIFAVWATLVWAGRIMLQESLMNFSLVILMGVLLFYLFLIISSNFRSLRNEFDSAFYFIETILFATVPLLASAILTWFLCIEVPSLDLPTCFSVCYFVYVLCLGKPRLCSYPIPVSVARDHKNHHKCLVLPLSVLKAVYMIPIIVAPILNIAVKFNMHHGALNRLVGFGISLLCPALLMLFCVEQQIEHWPSKSSNDVLNSVGTAKLVIGALLFACIQDHPLLDDIKAFSGLSDILASAAVCGGAALVALAVYIRRSNQDYSEFSSSAERSLKAVLVSVCLGGAGLVAGILMNLPLYVLPLAVGGAIALAEFYQRAWNGTAVGMQLTGMLLVFLGAAVAALVSLCFSRQTVFFLTIDFNWHLNLSIQQFCLLFSGLCAAAVFVPTLAYGTAIDSDDIDGVDEILPGGSGAVDATQRSGGLCGTVTGSLFAVLCPLVVAAMAAVELMVREQDWHALNVASVSSVYPETLFVGSALLISFTALHLYFVQTARAWTTWAIVVVQGCKLLHLVGIPSIGIAAVCCCVLAYTIPFAIHCFDGPSEDPLFSSLGKGSNGKLDGSDYLVASSEGDDGWGKLASAKPLNSLLLLFYSALAAGTTWWVGLRLAGPALSTLTLRDSSELQQAAVCVTAWSLFMSVLLVVFCNSASNLRSLFFVAAVGGAMVAAEVLSPFNVQVDPNSPTYLIISLHPELTREDSGFFLLLALGLALSAAFNLLAVQKPLARLLFAVVFSFCAAKALMGWAFPLTLGEGSPGRGAWELPWVFSFASTLFATSTTLHSSLTNTTSSGAWVFILSGCLPIAAILWATVADILGDYFLGIWWSGAVVNACIAVATRSSELIRHVEELRHLAIAAAATSKGGAGGGAGVAPPGGGTTAAKSARVNPVAASVCVMATFLSIFWCSLACNFSRHLNSDLVIPAAGLLILATKRGVIVPDAHPLAILALYAAVVWLCSSVYHIFIKGYGEDRLAMFEPQYGLFRDEDISVWTSPSKWLPWLSLAMVLVPLPAIALSFMRRKEDTEEMLFVLAVLSALPVVGAQATCIRLLGLVGLLFGSWRCWDIGVTGKKSNRLI